MYVYIMGSKCHDCNTLNFLMLHTIQEMVVKQLFYLTAWSNERI
jgi:hypothetical protein